MLWSHNSQEVCIVGHLFRKFGIYLSVDVIIYPESKIARAEQKRERSAIEDLLFLALW